MCIVIMAVFHIAQAVSNVASAFDNARGVVYASIKASSEAVFIDDNGDLARQFHAN